MSASISFVLCLCVFSCFICHLVSCCVLFDIHAAAVTPFSAFVSGVLDYLTDFSDAHIRIVYDIFAMLAVQAKAKPVCFVNETRTYTERRRETSTHIQTLTPTQQRKKSASAMDIDMLGEHTHALMQTHSHPHARTYA